MPDIIGQTIDRYQILEQLGQGGMATVYLAYDLRLERKVAVKIIRRDVFPPMVLDKVLKRFDREAKTLAKLNHPNIVPIIDYGSHNGAPYLVMPYVPSGTLKNQLGKPIPYQEAARLLAPIARALAYAHSEDIIHRDVKPSNILITQSGEPVLTDFGVAKLLEDAEGNTLTGAGMGLGTPGYMAPEQWQGKAAASSDQYALGVIFYEMVTGNKPYSADTPPAIMLKQFNEPVPGIRFFLPDLPQQLELIILKMMAKDPQNRYPDMNAVAAVLENTAVQQPSDLEKTLFSYTEIFSLAIDEQNNQQTIIENEISEASLYEEFRTGLEYDPSNTDSGMGKKTVTGNKEPSPKRKSGLIKWGIAFAGLVGIGIIIFSFSQFWRNPPSSLAPSMAQNNAPSEISPPLPTKKPENMLTSTPRFTPTLTLGIGSTRISEIDGMEMVYVPAGDFIVKRIGENGKILSEEKFTLENYWIDKYEISNEQFFNCVDKGFCDPPKSIYNTFWVTSTPPPGGLSGYYMPISTLIPYFSKFSDSPNRPVSRITFENAEKYCEWVERRLPTGIEWDKSIHGENGNIYPWGDDFIFGASNIEGGYGQPAECGSYEMDKSIYGVYDLAGNVQEWVKAGEQYYYKGGCYLTGRDELAQVLTKNYYYRLRSDPFSSNTIGFRCAMDVD